MAANVAINCIPTLYKIYQGHKFAANLNDNCIEFAINYKPSELDRVLITYPKCGTFWTQQIINMIIDLNKADNEGLSNKFQYWIECQGENILSNRRSGGDVFAFYTHFNYELLRDTKNAKYLIVMRNPKDVVVSFYHELKRYFKFTQDFSEFFKLWIKGETPFDDYFVYVKQYWIHCKNEKNFSILVYEEMKRDIKPSIETIAQFLGQKYVNRLSNDDKLMDQIIEKSSFDSMKKSNTTRDRPFHLRKGVVGDWRSVLTKDESDLIDKRVAEEWMGTGLELLWKEEMKWISD